LENAITIVLILFFRPLLGVHFQFAATDDAKGEPNNGDRLVAVTVARLDSVDSAVVLELASRDEKQTLDSLHLLLSDLGTVKVMHDVHRAAWYLHQNGPKEAQLYNCIDLQQSRAPSKYADDYEPLQLPAVVVRPSLRRCSRSRRESSLSTHPCGKRAHYQFRCVRHWLLKRKCLPSAMKLSTSLPLRLICVPR
jgi:hypothetical protein